MEAHEFGYIGRARRDFSRRRRAGLAKGEGKRLQIDADSFCKLLLVACAVVLNASVYKFKEVIHMKRLFSLLFATALAVSLAIPVFGQDQSSASTPSADSGAQTQTRAKKAKKSKKQKKAGSDSSSIAVPPHQ